jgi:ubiquitin carboxyl-terminal hydrolase 5/13
MEWIFSRDDLDREVSEVLNQATAESSASASASSGAASAQDYDDGEGKYSLMAIISHIGKDTDHGHYVCHIKKDGQWAFFNDEKVAKSKSPPLAHGFMYLFRRNDA